MALIETKHIVERESVSVKLELATLGLLKSYAEFIGSPQEYVVNQALLYVFRKDGAFKEHLKANGQAELVASLASAAKRSRRGASGRRPSADPASRDR